LELGFFGLAFLELAFFELGFFEVGFFELRFFEPGIWPPLGRKKSALNDEIEWGDRAFAT
jgi:hypothetical protein